MCEEVFSGARLVQSGIHNRISFLKGVEELISLDDLGKATPPNAGISIEAKLLRSWYIIRSCLKTLEECFQRFVSENTILD